MTSLATLGLENGNTQEPVIVEEESSQAVVHKKEFQISCVVSSILKNNLNGVNSKKTAEEAFSCVRGDLAVSLVCLKESEESEEHFIITRVKPKFLELFRKHHI